MSRIPLSTLVLIVIASGCFPDPDSAILERTQLQPLEVSGGRNWTEVAAGYQHTCAVAKDGSAWCWGRNDHSQVGAVPGSACRDGFACEHTPVRVSSTHTFLHISAGVTMSCALTSAGSVWCWGGGYQSGETGYLGDGTLKQSAIPVQVVADSAFVQVAVGVQRACALTATGQAWCWGAGYHGELGDGTQLPRALPVAIGGALRFSRLSLGTEHSCGVSTIGALYCWGHNRWGGLGLGDVPFNNFGAYTLVPTATGETNVVDVAAGGSHTCIRRNDGTVACTGYNSVAQLGDGATVSHRGTFGTVGGGRTYSWIRAGDATNCAIAAGEVFCWGNNYFGAVGNGGRSDGGVVLPTAVHGGPFTQVVVGGSHSCALSTAGRLYCWGDKWNGATGR